MSKSRVLWTLLIVSIACFWYSFALADVPADPSKDPTDALNQFWQAVTGKRWGIAAVVGTMLLVAFVRFIAPKVHGKFGAWVNSTRVSAALAFLSGLLMAIATQLFKGGKFSPQLIVYGFGFGVAAIGGYNAFWDIIFPADKQPKSAAPAAPNPVITKVGALLPLLIGLSLLSSCAHMTPSQKAYTNAFAVCMEQKGLAVAPSVASEVWTDLSTGTNKATIVAQLEALAGKAGTDTVGCAINAWLGSSLGEKNPAGVEAAAAFKKAHNV